jgi:hypothetical protein
MLFGAVNKEHPARPRDQMIQHPDRRVQLIGRGDGAPGRAEGAQMSNGSMTRRAALGSLAVILAGAVKPALARRPAGGIQVDVTPLRANAGDPTAAWVEQLLPGALAQAFAAHGASPGPVSVRIDYVLLGPNTGNAGGPAGSTPDQMVGEVTSGGVTRPLRATTYYYPSPVDQTMVEQSNFYRVQNMVRAFASWVAQGY